jgi:hypothetical protein
MLHISYLQFFPGGVSGVRGEGGLIFLTEHVPERWILNLLLVLCQCILILSSPTAGGTESIAGVRQFPEPVFVNVYGAQELIPMDRFRQPMYTGGPVRQIGLSYRLAMLGIDSWAP